MDKKGFTLTELLVVLVLIGMLMLIVTPNLIKIFRGSETNTMKVQENELKEAGLLYLEDFCKNPIYNNICPQTIYRNDDYTYSGHINLSTLITEEYIEEINIRESSCSGCVIYNKNKAESYLKCENGYKTETTVDFESECNI